LLQTNWTHSSPIALFINKESREEALKCYVKLDEGGRRCSGYIRRTPYVFFNMELDTLRTETFMVHGNQLGEFCTDHFEKPHRDILGQIQYLEIEEWAFDSDHHSLIHADAIKAFKKLKELKFIPIFGMWDEGELTVENGQKFINCYKDLFAKLAVEDPSRTIPEIVIAEFEGLGPMCKWYYQK